MITVTISNTKLNYQTVSDGLKKQKNDPVGKHRAKTLTTV